MREAGRLVGEVLTELASLVAPGVTTADLDEVAEKRIRRVRLEWGQPPARASRVGLEPLSAPVLGGKETGEIPDEPGEGGTGPAQSG